MQVIELRLFFNVDSVDIAYKPPSRPVFQQNSHTPLKIDCQKLYICPNHPKASGDLHYKSTGKINTN